jgi:superfamily I DNA/RNA helicase
MNIYRMHRNALDQGAKKHLEPLMERSDSGLVRSKYRMMENLDPAKKARFIEEFMVWIKKRTSLMRDVFPGRVYAQAVKVSNACEETDLNLRIQALSCVATSSGLSALFKWVRGGADILGSPAPTAQAVAAQVEGAQGIAENLQEVTRKISVEKPDSPARVALEDQKLDLEADLNEAVSESDDPATVNAAAASRLAAPSKIAQKFGLTPEQEDVMRSMGRVCIAAGAGSGKTLSMVATIAHLVEEKGYLPGQVMACSFTIAASTELEERVTSRAGIHGARIGTTHSIAREIIVRNRPNLARAAKNTKAADKLFKIAMKQVPLSIDTYKENQEKVVEQMARIQSISGWGNIDILKSFYSRLRGGRPLTDNQLNVLPKFEGSSSRRRYAEEYLAVKAAMQNTSGDQAKVAAPGNSSEEEGGKVSPYWTTPVGQWFNIGRAIEDAEGKPMGEKRARLAVENFKNEGKTVDQVRAELGDGDPIVALFGAYEWLKQNDPVMAPAMDFTDQLVTALEILKTDPKARESEQRRFKAILVDEAQDLNQCVHGDVLVTTEEGPKKVRDLLVGDRVLSFENGGVTFNKVRSNRISSWDRGYCIHLASGKSLTVSPNHRLYASMTPKIPEGSLALYLMFREGFGYRIGTSCRPISRNSSGSASRGGAERADCVWVLSVGETSEILYQEQALSLLYGIPTYPYEGTVHKLDQNRIDRLFSEFGTNGEKLLKERDLYLNYPHWTNPTVTRGRFSRRVLSVHAHRRCPTNGHGRGVAGSNLTMSWTGEFPELETIRDLVNVYPLKSGRTMLSLSSLDYRVIQEVSSKFSALGIRVIEDILIEKTSCTLTTASSLLPGMAVPVLDEDSIPWGDFLTMDQYRSIADSLGVSISSLGQNKKKVHLYLREVQKAKNQVTLAPFSGGVSLDEVVGLEPIIGGDYWDLEVEGSANFFGNSILSHNTQFSLFKLLGEKADLLAFIGDDRQSIYAFRGAKPANFVDLSKADGFQTKMLTMNFRSGKAIVDAANKLIAHNGDRQIPMVCDADVERKGMGAIRTRSTENHEDAADQVAQEIKDSIDAGESAKDFGILVRNNAEHDAYTIALLVRGIPYRLLKKSEGGYFGKPLVKALTSWMRLVIGGSPEVINDAVIEAHMTPGFGLDKEFASGLARNARGQDYLSYILASKPVYFGQANWLNKRVFEYANTIRSVSASGGLDSPSLIRAILNIKGSKGTFEEALMRLVDEDDVIEEEGVEASQEAIRNAAMAPLRPLMLMAENFKDPQNFLNFVAKMRAANEKTQKKTPDDKEDWKEPAVLVGTVHGWKGLQAKHCFVCMAGGVFPNYRSDEKEAEGDETAFDEERRLAYVAITRGEQTVTVMAPQKNYLGKPAGLSRFITEACIPIVEEKAQADIDTDPNDDELVRDPNPKMAKVGSFGDSVASYGSTVESFGDDTSLASSCDGSCDCEKEGECAGDCEKEGECAGDCKECSSEGEVPGMTSPCDYDYSSV